MRTHYGPLGMDRALARGRHRELTDEERDALYAAFGLGAGAPKQPAAPAPAARNPTPRGPPQRRAPRRES